jgi:lipase chaperone LimK
MDNLNEVLEAQNKRILTMQLLLEALVEELIETKKIKEEKLDDRISYKIDIVQSELDKARQEASINYLKGQIFTNQIGEA